MHFFVRRRVGDWIVEFGSELSLLTDSVIIHLARRPTVIPHKNARRLCFIFGGGGGGVESRPVDGGGESAKKVLLGSQNGGPKMVWF